MMLFYYYIKTNLLIIRNELHAWIIALNHKNDIIWLWYYVTYISGLCLFIFLIIYCINWNIMDDFEDHLTVYLVLVVDRVLVLDPWLNRERSFKRNLHRQQICSKVKGASWDERTKTNFITDNVYKLIPIEKLVD